MKYIDFFKLQQYPFSLMPDPRLFLDCAPHKQAFAYLTYGLSKGEGFVVITGEVGAGKTILADYFMAKLAKTSAVTAKISSTQFEADEFLRMVASSFGLPQERADKATVFRRLEAFLIETHRARGRAILIVDEAQGLPFSALEELRMLSNIYYQNRPLLQVFLVGQPEFRNMLASTTMEQLRQRVVAIVHLNPLGETEVGDYILHRLNAVGWDNDPRIAPDCFALIHELTRGVPRQINNLCDRLFWHAFIEGKHAISREDVEDVFEDMRADATGINEALGIEPALELPTRKAPEDETRAVGAGAHGSDRIVDFRNPNENEG